MKSKLEVIGSPISHTLSPLIHKTFLEYMNIEYEYKVQEVKKDELMSYISYVKSNSIHGFNVTMPLKQDIIEFLDDIDCEAKLYNSVNTVKNENGKLIGYNTDAEGYKMSLAENGVSLKNSIITVYGAGGAASSLVLKAALEEAKKITVFNSHIERAEKLKLDIKKKTDFEIIVKKFDVESVKKSCLNSNLFINATPLGMHGIDADYENLSFIDCLKEGAVVSDLIYNPYKTKLLKYSDSKNLKTINGLGMLIYQGLIADKIYFDVDFNFKIIKELIQKKYCDEKL